MKLPYFPLYGGDFLLKTGELTNAEVGAYIRLLIHQWANGSINGDPNRLPIGCANEWPELEKYFPLCDDGRRRNPRLERERTAITDRREKQRLAGIEGAKKRWGDDGDPNGNPNRVPIDNPNSKAIVSSDSSSDSSSEENPLPNKQIDPKPKKTSQPKPYKERVKDYYASIDEQMIKDWESGHPNVDVENELRRSKNWLLNNTNKAKKNFKSFINRWLDNQMERPTNNGRQAPMTAVGAMIQNMEES